MRILYFLFFFFFLCNNQLSATHIVGGEMTYRCIGDRKVEVTLTVFRDCYNGVPEFDSLALITVYDNNWNYVDYIPTPPSPDDTLDIVLNNPCLVAPPNVCVHRASYTFEVQLPPDTTNSISYNVVYQRCCRNKLIRNIEDPEGTGATFLVEITPKSLEVCNNSAKFRRWPPVSICVNEPIDFDHGADDIDGDSIVYELCTPFKGLSATLSYVAAQPGPYEAITWVDPPYNLTNVLGGDPLTIDSETGFLTGIPNTIGTYVVGICAKEYRNDTLISVLRRDFQYNVADCGTPTSAYQLPNVQCDDLTVFFDNKSQFVSDGYLWYFDLDNDTTQQSSDFEPTYSYPDTGTYTTMLIANPGMPCTDTSIQIIRLSEGHITADFQLDYPDCDSVLNVSVTDLSYDSLFSVVAWDWVLGAPNGQGQAFNIPNPSFTITTEGIYKLTLVATSANGCTRTLTQTFKPNFPDVEPLSDVIYLCQGDSAALFPASLPNFEYMWSPGFALSDASAGNPVTSTLESMSYEVTITNPINNCSNTGIVQVNVGTSEGALLSATASPQKIPEGFTSQLEAVFPSLFTPQSYSWSPSNTLDDATIPNPIASPSDSTLYTVTVTELSGCTSTASVWVYPVKGDICVEPFIFFPTGFSPNGDGENDVLQVEGNFISSVYWVIYDRWGSKIFETNSTDNGWDGTVNGAPVPPDVYGYYLKVGCPGGIETIRKGNVTLLR